MTGEELRRLRKRLGLTQTQLAAQVGRDPQHDRSAGTPRGPHPRADRSADPSAGPDGDDRTIGAEPALPQHLTPHSLRHSFSSLLLQQGESPQYVKRQLGHASITMTVDLYGDHLPTGNKAAVDRLDTPARAKVVAKW